MAMIGQSGARLNLAQLNDFCRDRKQGLKEEAINWRNANLEKIEENAGNPPNGANADRLPYDVNALEHVLKGATDPKEIVQLWEVSEGFREVLKRRYVETRLPDIIKLVINKRPGFLLEDMKKLDLDKRLRYQAFPAPTTVSEVEKQKYVKGFLAFLRQLSRQCKKSAEDLVRLDPAFVAFRTMEKLTGVNANIGANPALAQTFFPGAVEIDENRMTLANFPMFHHEVDVFLAHVGPRIHYFSYISYQRLKRETYERLRQWVVLMPNVEKLSVKCATYTGPRPRLRRGQGQEFPPELERTPKFPTLPSLRSFEDAWQLLFAPYIHRIVEANPTITDLHISEDANAKQKRIHSPQMFDYLRNMTVLQMVPDFALLNHHRWNKLNKLILEKPSCEQYRNGGMLEIPSCALFPILKQFEDTLEHLELQIDVYDICSHGGEYLQLKNLKSLLWKQHETFKNLNFLLYAGKLETLHIIAAIKDETRRGYHQGCACLKCYAEKLVGDGDGSFLGKSVWEVMPHLKWIRVVREYSRGDDVFIGRPN